MLDLTDETRSLLRMIHRYQVETMDSFAQRKSYYDSKCEKMLQGTRAAQKKHLDAVAQSSEAVQNKKLDSAVAQRSEE